MSVAPFSASTSTPLIVSLTNSFAIRYSAFFLRLVSSERFGRVTVAGGTFFF
jgi:hypothetical protein